ncbi:MAG: hypothetical protein Tsb009_14120 [Planctomycetaceae bacterium]
MIVVPNKLASATLMFIVMTASVEIHADGKGSELNVQVKQFHKSVIKGDVKKMSRYFADQILFDGDGRVVGLGPLDAPVRLTKRQILDSYTKLIKRVGREKWTSLFKKTKPTLTVTVANGNPIKIARKGDYVYDLHSREAIKGKRNGLDEAVIFIFRKVKGKYLIVAHFADY